MKQQTTSYVLAAVLSAVVSMQASADPLGYVSASNGTIAKDSAGNCVHTSSWTAANAVVPGCDGFVEKKPEPKKVAPAPAPAPVVVAPAPAPVVAKPEVVAAPVAEVKAVAKPVVLEGANFSTGSAKLLKAADAKLNEVVDAAKQNPATQFEVVGYTDNQGKKAANLHLSTKRAEAVKAYLVKHGVAAKRISIAGKGEADPVGDNSTAAGRAANRRVEISSK